MMEDKDLQHVKFDKELELFSIVSGLFLLDLVFVKNIMITI